MGQPIVVAEWAMYGNNRAWAHDSIDAISQPFGVTGPASTWYLAEGCTAGGMETFVLVQNPGGEDIQISMTFQTDSDE